MNKTRIFVYGLISGMLGEYLYRVAFNPYAVTMLILIMLLVLSNLTGIQKYFPKLVELASQFEMPTLVKAEIKPTQYVNIKKIVMEKVIAENSIKNHQDFLKQHVFTHCCFEGISNSLWYLVPDVIKGCMVHLGDRGLVPIKEAPPLELTPLSMITDEHAIELVKMKFNHDKGNVEDILTITVDKSFDKKGFSLSIEAVIKHTKWADFVERVFIGDDKVYSFYIDYLRSKEYAVPYNGISIEQMIEWKWLILKTK